MDSEANPSTILQTQKSVQHFAKAESDHVQLLDSQTTNVTNAHMKVSHPSM